MKSLTTNRLQPVRLVGSLLRRLDCLYRYLHFDIEQETSLASLLSQQAADRRDEPFLLFEGRRWSFREVEKQVVRRAYVLANHGISRGRVVALMMANRPEFLFNALAVNRLGAVSALVNTHLRELGLHQALGLVHPTAAIVGQEYLDVVLKATRHPEEGKGGLPILVESDGSSTGLPLPDGATDLAGELSRLAGIPQVPIAPGRGSDLALYIYTSGTTGHPKASRITNGRVLLAALAYGGGALGLGPFDTLYCCLPLFHASGFVIAFGSALFHGARLALAPRFSAGSFWSDIRSSRATNFVYIGEICRYLLNRPPDASDRDHGLRAMMGNGLTTEVWNAFVDRFRPGVVHEFYAATEGNVNIINFIGRHGSVGHFLPLTGHDNALIVRYDHDSRAPLRDRRGRCVPCRVGEVGELLGRIDPARVATRFEGYADQAQTETKILRDVVKPGDLYYRSGDLLRKDHLGFYYFVDRLGDTFRWKGENVSTSQVGEVLASHPGVEAACAFGVNIEGTEGKVGMAVITVPPRSTFDPARLYDHLDQALPRYACPAFLRLVEQLKMTATYKVRVAEYAEEGFDPGKIADPLFFRDDGEKTYRRLDAVHHQRVLAGEIRF